MQPRVSASRQPRERRVAVTRQIFWSNVGKNFAGSKLLAIWPYGETSRSLFDEHNYTLFVPPLAPAETAALDAACKVVGPEGHATVMHCRVAAGWRCAGLGGREMLLRDRRVTAA